MYKNLRILFTILSAICLAVIVPVILFLGWTWAGVCILLAVLFFGLMLIFKQAQEKQENPNGFSDLSTTKQTTDNVKDETQSTDEEKTEK